MFLTIDLSNLPFYISALIVTGIAIAMLYQFHISKYIFRVESFKKKWQGKTMCWQNFWTNVPCGTTLEVCQGNIIGRTNYSFKMRCGHSSLDKVPLADFPGKLKTGVYKKTWTGRVVHITEE